MVTDAECSSVMKPGARSAEQHPQQTTPPPQRAFNTYDVIADTHAVTMATPAAAADDDYLIHHASAYQPISYKSVVNKVTLGKSVVVSFLLGHFQASEQ